jgi:ribose 5-phosphate isomerase A
MTNVDAALALVSNGMTVGLGSGSASERFLRGLGDKVRSGLRVRGVPTSNAIAALAAQVGVPLVELGDALPLDLTVDGADEVDPHLNLIKGYGRALVREKIVAAASKKLVILIGPGKVAEKRVDVLGRRGVLPVEVVPFAVPLVRRELDRLGIPGDVLSDGGTPAVTDNGNHILHARVTAIADPAGLETQLVAIPGVVGTGLFVGMADVVLVEDGGRVEELRR